MPAAELQAENLGKNVASFMIGLRLEMGQKASEGDRVHSDKPHHRVQLWGLEAFLKKVIISDLPTPECSANSKIHNNAG